MASAWRSPISITMGATTSTSPRWKATGCFITKATASSKTSREHPASRTRISAPAPRGSITIATASWTCSSPTMFNGRKEAICGARSTADVKSYCTPESYKGTSSRLFHNLGGGKFEDVTTRPGWAIRPANRLGVTVLDFDNDGWPDIFVANDTQPNKLYHNNQERHL